jgi:hypothetical protein
MSWNSGVIAEFRKNNAEVGGYSRGYPMLLLHTTGAKTGKPRINPLGYIRQN